MKKLLFGVLFISPLFACTAQKEVLAPSGEWVLKNLFDEDVSTLQKPLTLKLDTAENRASGFAGCNQYFSTFSVKSSSIKFTGTGSTKMFCQETMATEMKFMTALEQVKSFKIKGNSLLLLADDKIILEFTK
jgi:heat shock protein HslJ